MRSGRRMVDAFEHWLGRRSPVGDAEILNKADFPWAARLEENWKTIRRELDAVLAGRDRLPNIQDISPTQRYLTKDGGWKTFFFHAYGHWAKENCRRCPETARLVSEIPNLQVAYFSILEPGKHIPAHKGIYKGLIRAHLGLIVPSPSERARMRVGGAMVHWKEGDCVVFDDTYEHEVWNDTEGWRVVLLIDVVRPFPFPFSLLNRTTLRLLRGTSFVKDSIGKHDDWEREFYGGERGRQ
ncbi:MAG: aspartyl/asparaginyl beta-hydroxylase domain-containing protein [Amphiplicatus sp.]